VNTVHWNHNNREKFHKSLEKAYRSYKELEMFVDYKLNEKLTAIASEKESLRTLIYQLVEWANSEGRLHELFEEFCKENPRIKDSIITELQLRPFVSPSFKFPEEDWEKLFTILTKAISTTDDFVYMQAAFHRAFKAVYDKSLGQIHPECSLKNLDEIDIKNWLKRYDDATLAVRFVEFMLTELQGSSEEDNGVLTDLKKWCDWISEKHHVRPKPSAPITTEICNPYLLIALEDRGSDVIVYPELYATGVEKSIMFGAKPTTCRITEVGSHISDWIQQAEKTLYNNNICKRSTEVILEVFLPHRYLEEDIATIWKVKDWLNRELFLGNYRFFLVRSLERVKNSQIQRSLKDRWEEVEAYVEGRNAGSWFHLQEDCPQETGTLTTLLKAKKALGLKFVAQLPTESTKRADLLYDIIDAPIPFALWSSEMADAKTLNTEFDKLLNKLPLTNFAEIARLWRMWCLESPSAKHIKLLCDRPDRLPKLPDPEQDEDLLVAF